MMTMMMMSMMGKKDYDTSNKWGEHGSRKRGRNDEEKQTMCLDDRMTALPTVTMKKNNHLAGLFANLLESRQRRVISNLFDGMIVFRF